MLKQTEYTWYIEPLDAHTNQVFSRELEPEDALREVKVIDRKKNKKTNKFENFERKANIWRCQSKKITAFSNSRNTSNLFFKIFSQKGKDKIRIYTPWWGKRQQKPVRKATALAQ